MQRGEIFLRQNAMKVAIMCVEAMHADNTTLDPMQETSHFDVMKPLYRILGELDAAAQAFVDADLQVLAKQVEDESDLNLSQLDFLESDGMQDDKD